MEALRRRQDRITFVQVRHEEAAARSLRPGVHSHTYRFRSRDRTRHRKVQSLHGRCDIARRVVRRVVLRRAWRRTRRSSCRTTTKNRCTWPMLCIWRSERAYVPSPSSDVRCGPRDRGSLSPPRRWRVSALRSVRWHCAGAHRLISCPCPRSLPSRSRCARASSGPAAARGRRGTSSSARRGCIARATAMCRSRHRSAGSAG